MGQGSSEASELTFTNVNFWEYYYTMKRLWKDLEREDSDDSDWDDDDPF